ncbi:MAG TPA: hypothetical protein VFJ51_01860, partial [Nitrososphaeraceae archaeon]|nr:hypothetical protein [Nitrososphaeraceae archaeon]
PTPGTLPSSAGGSAPIHVPDIGKTITDSVLGTSNAIQQAATDVLYKINSIIRQDPVILSPDQYYLLQNSIAIVNTNAVNNFDLIQRSLSR